MARRIFLAIADASVSLGRAWRSTILAVAAIVSAVFVLGAFLVVSRTLDDAIGRWSEAAELSVFLADDASATARARLEGVLRDHPSVRDVRVVTAEEARERFVKSFPDLAPLVDPQADAPLPASLEARLQRNADVAAVMALADEVRKMPEVADVRVDQELLTGLLNAARAGRVVGGALSLILLLAAVLAIASVVRLSYVARRDEIDVLYLLGAPLFAIRAPFVAEGAIQGALGTALAIGLLAAAYEIVLRTYSTALSSIPVGFIPASQAAVLVAAGIFVGGGAGYAAVRGERHAVE